MASRSSKPARVAVASPMPAIGMKLCVGDRALPLEDLMYSNKDGDNCTSKFLILTTRSADLSTFEVALGLYARSLRVSGQSEPRVATLKEIREAFRACLGKRNKIFARTLNGQPFAKNQSLDLVVRGHTFMVIAPRAECIWIEATKENITWLAKEFLADRDRAGVAAFTQSVDADDEEVERELEEEEHRQEADNANSDNAVEEELGSPPVDEETARREDCLVKLCAALLPGATVAWHASRNSLCVTLATGFHTCFTVKRLKKHRLRGAIDAAFTDATERTLAFLGKQALAGTSVRHTVDEGA